MVTTMAFLQYYLKSSTKRGWEMSSLLVAIQVAIQRARILIGKKYSILAETHLERLVE